MTTEKVQIQNPFEVILAKVANVEKQLQELKEKLAQPKSSPVNPNQRLTRKQLKDERNISFGTIHNLMKRGKLSYEKVGRKTLFRREDVERCFSNFEG